MCPIRTTNVQTIGGVNEGWAEHNDSGEGVAKIAHREDKLNVG